MELKKIIEEEKKIFDSAREKVIKTAQTILDKVPAYKEFLSSNNFNNAKISTFDEFEKLPYQTKHNYIMEFDLKSRCLDGTLKNKHVIFSSSGSTGEPQYWAINPEDEKDFPAIYNKMLKLSLDYENKSCLIVICLGLGAWVSGLQTHWALRQAGIENNGAFTVATPGIDFDSAIHFIKELGPSYDTIFLISYPGMVKAIFEAGIQKNIKLEDYNIRIGLVGDNFPESWRIHMEKKLGIDPVKEPMGIWGGYGSADIGGIGIESPMSIAIRKIAQKNPEFKNEAFGKNGTMPFLCRWNPESIYVECCDNELIFTKMKAIPVVRYKIHDSGGIIPYSKMLGLLEKHGISPESLPSDSGLYPAPLPFIYTFGKSHGDIVLSGANIYSNQIKEIISKNMWSSILTGRFKIKKTVSETFDETFKIIVELASGTPVEKTDPEKWSRHFQDQLREICSEYNALCEMTDNPEKYLPQIQPLPFGHEKFVDTTYKSIYVEK